MLFRKKVDRCCGLCIHSSLVDEDTFSCSKKKDQRSYDDKCLFFTYDPCKRIPAKAKALDCRKYEEYDYSL